jgi:ATP-dependent DNA helicase RecG
MQAAGLPVPTLQERTQSVVMTFVRPPGKTPEKTPNLILSLLRADPDATISELAQKLGKSDSAIERAIRKLRAEGKLTRIGPAKGGHWQVMG